MKFRWVGVCKNRLNRLGFPFDLVDDDDEEGKGLREIFGYFVE